MEKKEYPSIQDLVDKKQHPDFGWGVDGDKTMVPVGFAGMRGEREEEFDWSSLTWRNVIEDFYMAIFYDHDANPNYNVNALLTKIEDFGMDMDASVFSNNCGAFQGNLGCIFTGGCHCDDPEDPFGDCFYTDLNGNNQEIGYAYEHECNPVDYPGTNHEWVMYHDNPPGCCEGEWNMFYGNVPVWDFDDPETVEEIAAGPENAPSFEVTNTYPTFWDTLNYSCLSFGTGIMHWAHEKAQGTITFNDPWYQKYFLVVLSQIWESNYDI